MSGDLWRGLWHAKPASERRVRAVGHAGVYLVTPLGLAILLGDVASFAGLARAYIVMLVITASVGAGFELLYRVLWPLLIYRRPSWSIRIAGHAATVVLAVSAGIALANVVLRIPGDEPPGPWRMFVQGTVIATVIISILVASDENAARSRAATRREASHRVAALRAELAALQARTDPHFLFNSLNSLAALISEDPALAETLLLRLATVFRYALDAGRTAEVALDDELAAITAYLEVESVRVGPRLSWCLDRDPDLDGVTVPPFVLQPLVENAILHGASARRGATSIVVVARRRHETLVLAVEDQGQLGDVVTIKPGTGTALVELRKRLELAFADRALLVAGSAPPAGWRAEIVLPLEPSR